MQKEIIEEIVKVTTAEILKQRDNIIVEEIDNRYCDVKLLMKNYRKLKLYYAQVNSEVQEVDAICVMRHKTKLLMSHVDKMLAVYRALCQESEVPEENRRWDVLYMRYVAEERKKLSDIAELLNVDKRTLYRDTNKALEDMSVLLFGIESIEMLKHRHKKKLLS